MWGWSHWPEILFQIRAGGGAATGEVQTGMADHDLISVFGAEKWVSPTSIWYISHNKSFKIIFQKNFKKIQVEQLKFVNLFTGT